MNLMSNKILFSVFGLLLSASTVGQDLLDNLSKVQETQSLKDEVFGTFFGSRINLSHSVETREKGVLELSLQNRFWNIPSDQLSFDVDKVNIRLEASYALTDKFTIGAGYGTGYDSFDVFLKYGLITQKMNQGSPVSITLLQSFAHRQKNPGVTDILDFNDKIGSTSQLLIARKFSSNFSLQLMPTFINRAADLFLPEVSTSNRYGIGIGGRYRIAKHFSLTAEYYEIFNRIDSPQTYSPFSFGANWEIADVLLQFNVTNARNLVEDKFIAKSLQPFVLKDGDLHIGFNLVYLIHTKKK